MPAHERTDGESQGRNGHSNLASTAFTSLFGSTRVRVTISSAQRQSVAGVCIATPKLSVGWWLLNGPQIVTNHCICLAQKKPAVKNRW
jgi:hypothetical protein